MDSTIVNKVANSGLVTIELENQLPKNPRLVIDLADQLFQGLVLREKDFREWISLHDWNLYNDAMVAVHCSADAIVPQWAFMLVATKLGQKAKLVIQGDAQDLDLFIAHEMVQALNIADYQDAKIIIKGCSDASINGHAYTLLAFNLQPVAKSIMFGEPCSTVPLYKRVDKPAQ
jgi:hypothetical protein